MITLLKKSAYKESLWKNGLGRTAQIAMYPEESSLEENNFLWRISSAHINQENPFSLFEGCERKLIVWKGEGLLLNDIQMLPHTPLTFSGEENIYCKLMNNNPVIDFGIIYKKDLIKINVITHLLNSSSVLRVNNELAFLFLAEASEEKCSANNINLSPGDCLKIENENEITISLTPKSSALCYLVTISGI
jgi:environmental stress-induced protein Ves